MMRAFFVLEWVIKNHEKKTREKANFRKKSPLGP